MPKRSTGSRNTPARQARLQKLTKGTTDTISSLRGAMGFTPQAGSASVREESHLRLRKGYKLAALRLLNKLAALRLLAVLRLRQVYK
jgi:hypothetical protein